MMGGAVLCCGRALPGSATEQCSGERCAGACPLSSDLNGGIAVGSQGFYFASLVAAGYSSGTAASGGKYRAWRASPSTPALTRSRSHYSPGGVGGGGGRYLFLMPDIPAPSSAAS